MRISYRWLLWAWLLTLLTMTAPGWAATRFSSPTGSGTSCTNSGTPCTLQTAINQAVAGDTVTLANGTYTGQFTINANAGTSGSPITLRATNPHQAILQNSHNCANSSQSLGLSVSQSWWVIKYLRLQVHQRAVSILASNVVFEENLVNDFDEDGIRVEGVTGVTVRKNVVGPSTACVQNRDDAGIYVTGGSDNNLIEENIIVGTGDNGYQCGGSCGVADKYGYGMVTGTNSDDNTIRGNMFIGAGGKGVTRFLAGVSVTADRNIFRDNFIAWGEGGGSTTSDCNEDSNQFLNNIFYGSYYEQLGTKGNSGGNGHHIFRHNLLWMDEFVRINFGAGPGGCGGTKLDNTLQDNIFYSPDVPSSGGIHKLIYLDTSQATLAAQFPTRGDNLFWMNDANETNWKDTDFSYSGSDIAEFTTPPVFVNAGNGDFDLQAGSPGKNAASDGTDIGITYNTYLKRTWVQNAFNLQTQQHNSLTGATSNSFTGLDPNSFYKVWFYVPNAPCTSTALQFTIEGVGGNSLLRNIDGLQNNAGGGTWISGVQRWITLGKHKAADGTLNISWPTTNCVERLFIRRLPTADEAYTWITATGSPVPSFSFSASKGPTTVINDRVLYTWGVVTDATTCVTTVTGGTDATWLALTPSLAGSSYLSPPLAAGSPTYGLSCTGPGGTTPHTQLVTVTGTGLIPKPPTGLAAN